MDGYQEEMHRGSVLRRNGNFVEAADAFEAAERFSPGNRDALLLLATCLKNASLLDRAHDVYLSLVRQHPDFAMGWRMFGVFLKNIKCFAEAVPVLTRSLEIEDDTETRNTLVVCLFKVGQYEQAKQAGLQNLVLKDKLTTESFDRTKLNKITLGPPPRPFNPKTPHRNIISFALWGDNPVYVHGAIVNARIAPHIYYGWKTRFYCDPNVPADAIEELRRAGAQIIIMDDPAMAAMRPMWRFFVSDDRDVDWFICRDADCRLNCQELLAVDEWLRSGKSFHVMRDHIYHMELMLAGMWGGGARVFPDLVARIRAASKYHNNRFGDQAFLMHEIWPVIKNDLMTHDSCYGFHNARDFPSQYRLPDPVHVGGGIKTMPTWRNTAIGKC
jgi:hypothetical protein